MKDFKLTGPNLYIFCTEVANLWQQIEEQMEKYSKTPINFRIDTVIWNHLINHPISHVKNAICLIVKSYIYEQLCLQKLLPMNECTDPIDTIKNMRSTMQLKMTS